MCILLLSTTHPNYPLILLSNRDEFLHRPTQRAAFWEAPHEKVFGGRDLARPERGTWLGVSKNGRIAVLTNFRESSSELAIGEKSRGAMITSFLTSPGPSTMLTEAWIRSVLETGEMKGVGGFSMLCGTLRPGGENLDKFAIISNRTIHRDDGVEKAAHWVGGTKTETYGLSNSLFDDPWPKVKLGGRLLSETIRRAVEQEISEDELLEQCFAILSHNTLPMIKADDTYKTEIDALMLSIFIPVFDAAVEHANTPHGQDAQSPKPEQEPETWSPVAENIASGNPPHLRSTVVDTSAGSAVASQSCAAPKAASMPIMSEVELSQWRKSPRLYGTAQQTVVLVDTKGHLKYIERTLYDREARPIEGKARDSVTEFDIEGWSGV